MESEFLALTEAIKELLWFSCIIIECYNKHILPGQQTKSVLSVDNIAAISHLFYQFLNRQLPYQTSQCQIFLCP